MVTTQTQALTFSQNYETAEILLTSPILRIGGAVSQLNPYEYVQSGNRVYLPNQEALARVLQQRGKLNDYIQKIEDKEDIIGLLKSLGENWLNLKDNLGNPVFPKIGISRKWVDGKITDLRPMIRNGFGEPYIPGSSIKGAIRTAIAFYLLKHANQYHPPIRVSEIEQQLREKLDRRRLKPKKADDQFMGNLFEDFSLQYQDKTYQTQNEAQRDLLRTIHISDSQPLLEKTLINKRTNKRTTYNIPVATEVIVSSHFNDDNAKYKAPIYAEMLHNVRAKFTITVDTEMLGWFRHKNNMQIPFENINDLMNICQEFSQYQWDKEVKYWENIGNNQHKGVDLDFDLLWEKYYAKHQCPYQLRLGWGTGMGGTTINWLIDDDLRAEIRDACGKPAPNFQAPKSRRTILNPDGDIRYVPGWAKLKVL